MALIDLHTHSNYSDGTYSPEELMIYAKEKKLSAIALTDHDTTEGLLEAELSAKKLNIEFIPGIEINAEINNKTIHILGLFIDYDNKDLNRALTDINIEREARNKKMVERFNEQGMDFTYEDILNEAGGNVITRAHFANYLLKNGYGTSIKEIFKTHLSSKSYAYVQRKLMRTKEAIEFIHQAKGIASFAHPGQYGIADDEISKITFQLKKEGLDAIEAVYTTNTKAQEGFHRSLSKQYNLKVTGGSDFHGKNKPNIDLGVGFGNLRVGYEVLEGLRSLRS